jgi:cytochrome oxidase Cu insertion factor (SCO1/SenC/PrrC family)
MPYGAPTFLDVRDAAVTQSTHRPHTVLHVGERSRPASAMDDQLPPAVAPRDRTVGIDSPRGRTRSGSGHLASQTRTGPSNLALTLLGVVVALSALFAVFAGKIRADQGAPLRASGLPAAISTNTADLMGLTRLPGRTADDFVLTDQHGRTMSFASFRGRTVVLEFMDPHCTDICPIVSQEFVDAYHDLGSGARNVEFVAVNVNRFHGSVAAMSTYSQAHLLSTIPTWHFFTGPIASLAAVWHAYNISVIAPGPNADIIHTSAVYFIDPSGHERYAAFPADDHTASGKAYLPANQIASWGRGVALVLQGLSQ